MSLVFFPCCVASAFVDHAQVAARLVVDKLGVEIKDGSEFNCCGYPYKGIDFKAFILLSGRNLALAEMNGADLVTTCGCCYGTTKQAESILKHDVSLSDYVNNALKREGLAYKGKSTVKHLVEVLLANPGIANLKARLDGTQRGLRVATHYGCKLLRPNDVVGFDSPFSPSRFDQLIEATGAVAVPWSEKLECCGAPLIGINDATSVHLAKKKLVSARQAKADLICTACPCCYLQFERTRESLIFEYETAQGVVVPRFKFDRAKMALTFESVVDFNVPSLAYVQVIGLALGLDETALGVGGIKLTHGLPPCHEGGGMRLRAVETAGRGLSV
jgi:heterodisulfide reductase subunit B